MQTVLRKNLIQKAASLPKGSEARRAILSRIKHADASDNHKPVRLTPKEIERADTGVPGKPFTIVVRPQSDGGYWVAAISLKTKAPLFGWSDPLGQYFVDSRSDIPSAVKSIGRDLHKLTGYTTDMTDKMRHNHNKPWGL
jgi:hypothetical protein